MADIDLKTETPDTSLPTTGFLFGADSQASASPSVYSTQTVATTLLGSTSLTGATITTSQPVLDLSQTWDAGAVTFTGLRFNVPTDSSASGSLLMDLQVGGSSRFNVGKTGSLKLGVSPTGTNQAGTNVIIAGSQGTGTGAGGSIIFQVAPAGSTGTAQNALATALTINSAGQMIGGAGSASVPTFAFTDTNYGSGQSGMFYTANGVAFGGAGGSYYLSISNLGLTLSSGVPLAWSSGNGTPGSADTILRRDAANTLALRNDNNGQTFRLYGRFTDITNNFERFFISAPTTSGNAVQLGTQKGATAGTARALAFQTDGTTRLTIETNGDLTIADAKNIILGTTTGTKIGTATTQKIGFYNATPVVQPTAVADATDNATAITQLNALLSRMRDLGLIAT